LLAVSYFKVVPKEELMSLSKNPVGTGPFKFCGRHAEKTITLTRNENYYQNKAYLDSLIFIVQKKESEKELFEKFCNEELDILNVSRRLDTNSLLLKYQLLKGLKLGINFIGFNLQSPYLKELEMRQAIAYAINREEIVNQSKSTYRIANGIFPAGLPGFQPRQKCYPFNPQKARQLLKKLDLSKLDTLQCWTNFPKAAKEYSEVPKIIQQNLIDVGIKTEIKTASSNELISAIRNGQVAMFHLSFVAGIPLPSEYLADSFSASGGNNLFNYNNPEVDCLIDSSRHLFNYAEKIKLLQLVEQKILKNVPIIPLFYSFNAYLCHNDVHGIEMGHLGIANIPMEKIWKD
jgi:peptide/nickel transport system substrate-binding protein